MDGQVFQPGVGQAGAEEMNQEGHRRDAGHRHRCRHGAVSFVPMREIDDRTPSPGRPAAAPLSVELDLSEAQRVVPGPVRQDVPDRPDVWFRDRRAITDNAGSERSRTEHRLGREAGSPIATKHTAPGTVLRRNDGQHSPAWECR